MVLGGSSSHRRPHLLLPVRARPRHRPRAGLPEDYDKVVATYKTPVVSLLEYGLVAAILFHALNGLRIIAVDYWTQGPRYQKQMFWTVMGLWILLMLGAIYPVLGHAARVVFGS